MVASFDLVAALGRQAGFLHSVLRACYLETPFLEKALLRWALHTNCADAILGVALDSLTRHVLVASLSCAFFGGPQVM